MFLTFCFSSSKHNIILLLKYTCVEFVSIKLQWKNQIKKVEKHNHLSVRKIYLTSRKGIGDSKKKQKNSKSKTTTLTYFGNLKKKQQDQGGKGWCHTKRFMSLRISTLRATAFSFENNKLLK